jgi:hypothetical protein
MKPQLFKFNEVQDTIEWVLEDTQAFMDSLPLPKDQIESEPVAFKDRHHYILFWDTNNAPSINETKALLNAEGVSDDCIYDLTDLPFIV